MAMLSEIYVVDELVRSQGHRSTCSTVASSSSNDGENRIVRLAESERTLDGNHALSRGRLYVLTQVMFGDTQDEGIISGDDLHVGEDGGYCAYLSPRISACRRHTGAVSGALLTR